MNVSALIDALEADGVAPDVILRAIRAADKKRDDTNAERQARYRERRAISQNDWDALRGLVFARDGLVCTYCGANTDLVCDHVTPLVAGGTNDLDNLVIACRSCNASKGGRLLEEWQ